MIHGTETTQEKTMTTYFNRLRLRHGLRWHRHYPTLLDLREFLRGLAAAVLLVATYGLMVHLDDLGDRAAQMEAQARAAERAAAIYEASAEVLRDCERGATGYYYADGRTYQCGGEL